jgi:hypothetical protein
VSAHRYVDDGDRGDDEATVRRVQPYEATKTYRCPGCDHPIPPGTGHVVVVPADPTERRHWHRACWERAVRAAGGRRRR